MDSQLALFPQTCMVKGNIPELVTLQWFSIMAPAGIPKVVQNKPAELLARVSQDPEILQQLTAVGLDVRLSLEHRDLI